ncbi:MAG: hypothetical protein JWQ83_1217 [Lacunisphaera sp.]|jgi:hypothetical protein|nr:hypothetical protein [Lacunisphaera sp.]MDB6166077.1 hypothetical protein [Lacunisphaera sp.]
MPHPRLHGVLGLGAAVYAAAEVLDRHARKKLKPAPIRRGATLRPGVDTPLWRALVTAIRPLLQRRGAKALLARELGLHRSRLTQFFVKQAAMPDAERTLLLLEWYRKQRLRTGPAGAKNRMLLLRTSAG